MRPRGTADNRRGRTFFLFLFLSLPRARLGLTLVLALLVAACNSRALPPPPGAPPAPPPPKPGSTPPPHRAQVVVAEPGAIGPLDPALGATGSERDVVVNVYDRLVELDPALQPAAGLATGWRHAGATTWEFSLRKGVSFSDGEPFDAATVVAWFDRLRAVSPGGQDPLPSVSRVQRVDDVTVRFETREPDPLLPRRLASPGASITPPGPFGSGGENSRALVARPVGTGPYVAADVVPGERVVLVPNTRYWGAPPKVQEAEIRAIPDASARAAALEQGVVDVALRLPPAEVPAVKATPGLAVPPVVDARRLSRVSLDTAAPGPLADPRVRQALNYAVDKQGIIDGVLAGQAVQNATLSGQGSFGYCPARAYPYDPDRAQALLQAAGVQDLSLKLELAYSSPEDGAIVQALAQSMAAAGIEARPAPTSDPGAARAWFGTTTVDVLDVDESLRAVQDGGPSRLPAPFGGQALLLYQQERRETNDAKRADLACQIHQVEREAAPVLFLWQENLLTGLSRKTVVWKVAGDGLLRLDRLTPVPPPGSMAAHE